MTDEVLPPTQYLIIETLTARARLGENAWTFPSSVVSSVRVLERRGYVGFKSATTYKHILVWFTEKGREAFLTYDYLAPVVKDYQDLLASIWLYIKWQWITKQLTTEQKELFADSIDANHKRMEADEINAGMSADLAERTPVERWWRD